MARFALWPAITLVSLAISGCASLLPTTDKPVEVRWQSFKEVEAAYNMVRPGETTRLQLRVIGFDPKKVPNSKRIDYYATREILMGNNPNIKIEDLPSEAQTCIRAGNLCAGEIYELNPMQTKEEGNFFANKTDYRVAKRTTGWMLNPTFFFLTKKSGVESDDDIVVEKRKLDAPDINQLEVHEDKLGPAKAIGGGAMGVMRKLLCPFC